MVKEDATQMLQYVNAVRQSVYAAKAIKDIAHNLKDFDDNENDILHQQCGIIRNEWISFDSSLNELLNLSDKREIYLEIDRLTTNAVVQEELQKSEAISQLKCNQLVEVQASTLMNVHRELLSCKKSLLYALRCIEMELLTKT